jgi:alpha-beta hydrolase superfamily lysophospholipase
MATFKRKPFELYDTTPEEKMSEQKRAKNAERKKEIDHVETLPCQILDVTSFDGIKLTGRLFRAEENGEKRLVICVHGYKSNGRRCYGGFVPVLNGMGLDALVIENRAHGDSEGDYTGFSVLDRVDVKYWVEKMSENYDKIYLMGSSMGASTAGLVTADLPEIKGLVFDCGFTEPIEAFRTRVGDKVPPFVSEPTFFFGRMWCKMILGFDFKKVSTLEEMKKIQCPVLFIQGAKDTIVPKEMAEAMYEACPSENKKLEIFEEAEHGASFYVERERYVALLEEFFN